MKNKKLTNTDFKKMWGEDGPYSQVRLCEEIRILDDSVSRVFLVVEAEINPFTFEYVENNRVKFENDVAVLQLLNHAEYRGKFGYVVSAGEIKLDDKNSKQFARKQADSTTQTLIRMHRFVMDEYNLGKDKEFGVIEDSISTTTEQFFWNEEMGAVESVSELSFGDKSFVSSTSGIKNNKMRFYIILGFVKNFNFTKDLVVHFAKTLERVSKKHNAEVEDVESFVEHVFISVLIPFDVAPSDFIEEVIEDSNSRTKKIFIEDYVVSNVEKPSQEEIMNFLNYF